MKKLKLKISAEELRKKLNIRNGVDGLNGIDGKDGKDGTNGVDGKNGTNPDVNDVVLEATAQLVPLIPKIQDLEKQIPQLGEPIRDSLELLVGDDRLDKSAIKGLEEFTRRAETFIGGGSIARNFYQLFDVPQSYAGQALKSLRVKSDETGLEFFTGSGLVDWGEIGGTLSNQTDLQTALDAKQNIYFDRSSTNLTPHTSGDHLVFGGADGTAVVDIRQITGVTQGLRIEADSTAGISFSTFVTGDSFTRFSFLADGTQKWGGGTLVADTNLYRSSANVLKTDDDFVSIGLTATNLGSSLIVYSDGSSKLQTLPTSVYPSLTELSYVKGVTSSIQTQLNSKFTTASAAALTASNDTNMTLTLGGSPTTALLAATSISASWTGQLSVARGGTGLASWTTNGIVYASGTTTLTNSSTFTWDGTLMGVGVAGAAKLHLGGNVSATAWTTNGIGLRVNTATYTDTSSSGTVPQVAVHSINTPTIAASNSTTFTDAATLYLNGVPTAGSNVIISRPWVIYSPNTGASYHRGDLYVGTGKTNSVTLDNITGYFQGAITDPAGANGGNAALVARWVTTLSSGTNSQSSYGSYHRTQIDQANQSYTGTAASIGVSSTVFGISGTVTTLFGIRADVRNTAAGSLTNGIIYSAAAGTNSGSGLFANYIGFDANDSSVGSTLIAGFRGQISSGTNKYNLYMSGTAANYLAGTLELGHLTDTTVSRSAAGVIAVEGVVIPSISSTNTITNKRNQKRVYSAANNTSLTPEIDTYDIFHLTAMSGATTINNHSTSTPADGEMMLFRFLDNGTARALTWGTNYVAKAGTALPTTTTLSKNLACLFEWNANLSKWNLLSVGLEA